MPVEEKVDKLERALEEFVTNVGLEITDLIVRRKKRLTDGRIKEYDTMATAGE